MQLGKIYRTSSFLVLTHQCSSSLSEFFRGITKLFVGNIARGSDPMMLRQQFEKFGTVEECDILADYGFVVSFDKLTSRIIEEFDAICLHICIYCITYFLCAGFLQHFALPEQADAALVMNGFMFNGLKLKVEKSTSNVRKKAGGADLSVDVCVALSSFIFKGVYFTNFNSSKPSLFHILCMCVYIFIYIYMFL